MSRKPLKIIFLTSTNLASNPRCLKEIELANEMGYSVTLFAFDIPNWTRSVEKEIKLRLNKIEYYSLQTAKKPLIPWLIYSLAAKGAKLLYKSGWKSTLISAAVTDKRSLVLLSALRKKKPSGDLIIAHNPGAFYPAWWLSKKTGIPFAIDIEDFHPGENNGLLVQHAVTRVMKTTLLDACYVSFASPMIRENTLSMFKERLLHALLINNVFSSREFPRPKSADEDTETRLKLVWFSQHISFKRGLDEILPLLQPFGECLQLTLIGNIDLNFKSAVLDQYKFITIKDPMPQEILNAELGNHDIGLALESNNTDENRKICLTNKIWAYLQAGLYIWANNTPAQVQFANEFLHHTSIINLNNKETVIAVVKKTLEMLPQVRNAKRVRWEVNEKICWEAEKKILIKQWDIAV